MFIEWIGWVADGIFVIAYLLVSQKKLSGDGKVFNIMNLFGAILFGFYGWQKGVVPVLILEMFWGGIAFIALYQAFRSKQR